VCVNAATVGKTLNLRIQTEDNLSLGAWFVFADGYYQQTACPSGSGSRCSSSFNNVDISRALRTHKTILYFHGNAASRALPHRVRFYSQWSSRVNVNVLAIDYRGFADSEGSPTEAGLGLDAKAAWDWAITHGAAPEDIIFFGQSLGTGVTAKLAHRLSVEGDNSYSPCFIGLSNRYEHFTGVHPRGVVLSGAFIDLATLLETYNIGGWIPLLQPMQFVPFFFSE
jgi:abhydrolase domain-containing protein 12